MVASLIEPQINYNEDLNIDTVDKNTEVSLFKLTLLDVEVVIALGQLNTNAHENIYYSPVYLIVSDTEYYKIGIYEFLAEQYINLIDDDNDIDISKLKDPLLFSIIDEDFLKEKTKNGLIKDIESNNSESENSDDESDDDTNDIELKSFSILEDDDDMHEDLIETEKQNTKFVKKFIENDENHWIENHFKNNNYNIIDNEGGGDCFFSVIRDAFKGININISVQQQRKMFSEYVNDDLFKTYKELYDNLFSNIKSNQEEEDILLEKRKLIRNEYNNTLSIVKQEKDRNRQLQIKEKLKEIKETYDNNKTIIINLRKEKKESENILKEFQFMQTIKNIDQLKEFILTSDYWANSSTISILEELLNIKTIILNNEFYHNSQYQNILQCGDMVPNNISKKGIFKPKYYILFDYNGTHYQLITYKNKTALRFHDIPFMIKQEILNKCLQSKGTTLFDYIPKFQNIIKKSKILEDSEQEIETKIDDEDNEVEMIPSVPDENNSLYDDSVVLAFYSKSSDKHFPGEGASESITALRKSDYMKLSKIKNWRKMLSNFYVKRNENNEIVPLFELDGYKWASVEHYYHANKFIKENPDFYKKFTMDEQTEISFDPSKARGAGGKTGKIKGILFRPESVKMDSTFMDNKNNENIMYKAQYEKYRQNEELKNMLLLTNDSKLIHIVRGQDNVPFWNTMKIRQRLKSLN